MKKSVLDLQDKVNEILGDAIVSSKIELNELTIEIALSSALQAFSQLKNDLNFEQLIDLCGVDYLSFGQANWETQKSPNTGFNRGIFDFAEDEKQSEVSSDRRFAVVYHLLSLKNNQRLRVKVYSENTSFPVVPSVMSIWRCADWFEREAFDLFGIVFDGHTDLRRILTDYGFVGHPLRKDFPLTGYVEMRYDAEKQRVVYEPVSIENRVNVPRVIRDIEAAQG